MPDLQSTIDIIFRGIDDASKIANQMSGNIQSRFDELVRYGGSLESLAAPIANVANNVLKTESAVTALGAAMVFASVRQAGDFNDSFNQTRTLFDETGPAVSRFRDDILQYAVDSTQSIGSINQALQSAIGQGVDYADSLGLIRESEKLAIAQSAGLNESTILLASTLNGYGLKIDQAAKLSDQFSITVRDGKISVAELSAQLSNVVPIAAAVNVGYDQLGAAIAVLTAQGFKAEPAITGVKNILSGIINPTEQAANYAASLGIQFNATALQSKGLEGVLIDVKNATGGNVEKMAQLFTTSEGLTAALALSGKGAASFKEELQKMREETGVTSAAYAKMADNASLALQRIKNAFDVAAINLGTPLLDEFGRIGKGIADALKAIGVEFNEGGALRPMTTALESFGAEVGATVERIAQNIPAAMKNIDLSGLIDAYKSLGIELGGLFRSFFGDIDLTTVDGLSEAIQRVIDTIEALTRITAGIVKAFDPFAQAAGVAIDRFNSLDEASKIDFGEFLGSAKAIVDAGLLIGGALLTIGKTTIEIGPIFDFVFGGAKVAVNSLQVTFDAVVLGLLQIEKSLMSAGLSASEFGSKVALTDAAKKQSAEATANFKTRLADLDITMDAVASNLERNKTELEAGWTQATNEATGKTAEFREKLNTLSISLRSGADATAEANEQNRQAVTAYDGILAKLNQIRPAASSAVQVISDLGDAQKKLIVKGDSAFIDEPIKNLRKTWDSDGNPVYTAIGNATIKATNQFKSVGDSASEQAKKVDETIKKSQEYQLKMEELASNERIKVIEAHVQLNVAELEAQTKQIEATFKSLDNTVSSTGDLLGSLFSDFAKSSGVTQAEIASQIDLENQRRQKVLDLQAKMTEAEIDKITAQTAALQRGNAMIQIDGSGLAPQLEAFMWEVLKAIRVRANAEFQSFLLGTT